MQGRLNAPRGAWARFAALAVIAGLGASLSGCIGYEGDFDRGYQVDEQTLNKVSVGKTSKPEALSLLGTPSTTSTIGGDAWYYVSQRTERSLAFMPQKITDQRVVAIYFDKDRKVTRVADYGLEDGKPVDFLSRTTPVAGPDYHLIQSLLSKISL